MFYTVITCQQPCLQFLYYTLGSINLAVNFNRARQSCFYQTVFYQSGTIGWRGIWKGHKTWFRAFLHDKRSLRGFNWKEIHTHLLQVNSSELTAQLLTKMRVQDPFHLLSIRRFAKNFNESTSKNKREQVYTDIAMIKHYFSYDSCPFGTQTTNTHKDVVTALNRWEVQGVEHSPQGIALSQQS